jgi:hypothetical protein
MKQSSEHGSGSRIGRGLATAAVALLCIAALSQPNPAYAHDGGGGGGSHGGGGGGFHGGGGGGGFHGGGGGFHGGGFHGGGIGGGFHSGFPGGGFSGGGFHGGAFSAGGLGRFHGGEFHGGFRGAHFGGDRGDFRHRGGDRDDFRHRRGFGGWWGGGVGWDAPYYDQGYADYSPYGYSQPYASQYWYYCQNPAGYYPYVQQCSTGWQTVPTS